MYECQATGCDLSTSSQFQLCPKHREMVPKEISDKMLALIDGDEEETTPFLIYRMKAIRAVNTLLMNKDR